jgi:hypothetical protein
MKLIAQQIKESGITNTSNADYIRASFAPFFEDMQDVIEKAKTIKVVSESDIAMMESARKIRLELKSIRVNADKVRKALKEDTIAYNKAVQSVYNVLEYEIKPIEAYLELQEKYAEVQAKMRKDKMITERKEAISEYAMYLSYYNESDLEHYSSAEFADLLQRAKEAKALADAKAIQDKIEAQERERVASLHNVRMRELIPYANFISGFNAINFGLMNQSEYVALADKAKLERAAYDAEQAEIKAERDKLQAELDAANKAKAEAERAEREAKQARERAELEQQRELAKQAAMPDYAKIKQFGVMLSELQYPQMTTKAGVILIQAVKAMVNQVVQFINQKAL